MVLFFAGLPHPFNLETLVWPGDFLVGSGRTRMNHMSIEPKSKPVHPDVRIGHVHLKVADLERALGFYRDVLGFVVTQRLGKQAAFLSAGGYHHQQRNIWESQGGFPPHRGAIRPPPWCRGSTIQSRWEQGMGREPGCKAPKKAFTGRKA